VVDVIVQFNHIPGSSHRNKIVQYGGSVQTDLHLVKALRVSISASRLADLARDGEVAYISPNRSLGSTLNNSAGAVLAQYAWAKGLDGKGIGVAVIDSGVHSADDLMQSVTDSKKGNNSRVAYNFDSIGGGTDDQYGHGTHVAGIIGGNAADSISCKDCSITLRGLAPDVTILNFHALDKNGQGTDASVIAAIHQAIAVKSTYNIRVMNLSLGRPVFESYTVDPLCQAVEAAWKAGIVVVVAAGNDGRDPYTSGYATITAPGNDPYVITVGAMNTKETPDRSDDVMTTYSSKGPTAIDHIVKPDLVAPGNRVISLLAGNTLAQEYPQNILSKTVYGDISKNYYILSGTSMAAPVVSGAAALLLEQSPQLTPDQVKSRLMKTAYKTFPRYTTINDSGSTFLIQYDAFTVGAGYLDIQAALLSTDLATLSAKSPAAVYDPVTGNVYFVSDSSAMWGSSGMWGSSAVWGANAFVGSQSAMWGSSALWGNSAMWGNNTTQAFSAVWGSSALWGSSAMWGSTAPDAMSVLIEGDK
jgi:serine protease AprX